MTDAEFEKQKSRVELVWRKWVEVLGLNHYHIEVTYSRERSKDFEACLASSQSDWHYRQMFVFFYLPQVQSLADERLDNLVLHEIAHMLVSPIAKGTDSEKHELATENVALAIEAAYKIINPVKENSMANNEKSIEKQIKEKGLTAPRVTPESIDAKIVSEQFHVFDGTTVTVCALTLQNGFVVTGESASASPENFDPEIGRRIARDNARNKIWALEGYLLREQLSQKETK